MTGGVLFTPSGMHSVNLSQEAFYIYQSHPPIALLPVLIARLQESEAIINRDLSTMIINIMYVLSNHFIAKI